jgi:hypothetical protein
MCFVILVLAGCAAVPSPAAPATADEFTQAFQAMNDWAWSGADQATSLRASNGIIYWSFGDTIVGEQDPETGAYRPGWTMLPNTILRQDGGVFTAAVEGVAVPSALNGDRYWPMGMVEANGFLYAFCQRVRNTATYFDLRGVELAKFAFEPGGGLSLVGMLHTPSTWALGGDSPELAQYGADAVYRDGWIYVFGFSNVPGDLASPQRSYVAKVAAGDVEDPRAWWFWTADPVPAWVKQMDRATPIVLGQVTSVRLIQGRWVLAFKPWNGWGDTVQIEVRDAPFGPARGIVRLSSPPTERYTTYAPQLHPEQRLRSGRLLVSLSYNSYNFELVGADADLYKPRFFEVSLPQAFGRAGL